MTRLPIRLPWITLLVAAVAIFNPLGWEIIGSAIRYAPTDWLRDLWVLVALTGVAILVLMGLIEVWVRGRQRHRALTPDQTAKIQDTPTET